MATPDSPTRVEPSMEKMSRMYRWMRHVCDNTRRYYLLGRDKMLDRVAERPAGNVVEVGCGTARNLCVLDDKAPHHTLYGLDASLATLATARDKLERTGRHDRITLAQGLAQEFDPKRQFGIDGPVDVIFFSYVLSRLPSWPAALGTALSHLEPDGRLYVVDFWDQDDLPRLAGAALKRWLDFFDVESRPDLLRTLRSLDAQGHISCTISPVARRYAYLATVSPQEHPSVDRSETGDPAIDAVPR